MIGQTSGHGGCPVAQGPMEITKVVETADQIDVLVNRVDQAGGMTRATGANCQSSPKGGQEAFHVSGVDGAAALGLLDQALQQGGEPCTTQRVIRPPAR